MLQHHPKLARYFFIFSSLLMFASLLGCERLQNKWERRERKLHYLNEEIDSARKLDARIQDSIRHHNDSLQAHGK
ncbi:MAG: hypothetical protein U0264_09460 [Candidatus Kapaibacterium sp.]